MVRRRHLKRKRVRVRLLKEPSVRSLTGVFKQNCTIQASICFDIEYLCRNLSIALGRKIYPCDPILTEEGIKAVLAKIRGRMEDYMTDSLVEDYLFWSLCVKGLVKGGKINADS